MDTVLKKIFYAELARQCDFIILGYEELTEVIQQRQKRIVDEARKGFLDIDSDHTFNSSAEINRIFFLIQGMLVSCANISKILWPGNPRDKTLKLELDERASILKKELNLKGLHVLKNRDMRDDYEHFDERIHIWFKESDQKNFVDTSIGPLGVVGGIATKDMLRWYDSSRGWLVFRGHVYKLCEIIDSVRFLRSRL